MKPFRHRRQDGGFVAATYLTPRDSGYSISGSSLSSDLKKSSTTIASQAAPVPPIEESTAQAEWGSELREATTEDPDSIPYRDDVPPQLPYSLHERKWSILIVWTILVLDSCVLPVGLFFILKYAVGWDDTKNLGASSGIFGFVSLLQYALRFYRLLIRSPIYRPLNAPRWYFDVYQYQFTFGFILITVFVSVGVGPQDLRLIGFTPVLLPLQCAPQLLFSCWAYKRKWKIPFRFSSMPKGSEAPPAVFTIVEDVVGVDGRGGLDFRRAWLKRYKESWYFRELLWRLTLFWGIGAFMCFGVTAAVVLPKSVGKYVAFAFGWTFPFIWAGMWALLTIFYVKGELKKEQEVWSVEMTEIRARERQGGAPVPSIEASRQTSDGPHHHRAELGRTGLENQPNMTRDDC
ncbi:hypothetical protein EX30DRAFT_363057 [Ascodesmis nigricans]|uniref:Uncharacterized protein n=1 Tax=Ascodesmis nigricans TaxID=341454 RepID=A0A4S2N0I3_9PEZI|nr:hypothetical protein EX30DRAFT_363057 [Ascodesmis nigricans]